MNLLRLVTREIAYRKLSFCMGLAAVLVAVGGLVAELTLLRSHHVRVEEIGAKKEEQTRDGVARLQDAYRKIMKGFGYNILILHRDQDLGEFYAGDKISTTMPEEYVEKLAKSGMITVQHLLPTVQFRLLWPERKCQVIAIGTRGEAPQGGKQPREPMLAAVSKGTMVIGHVLHKKLNLRENDKADLLGRSFTVARVHPLRGNEDDVTVWLDLGEAQEMLGKQGRINAILALSCLCPGGDLEGITKEVTHLLPDTQVIELTKEAAIRRAARSQAAGYGDEALAAEKAARERLRVAGKAFADWVIPLIVVGSTVWVGLLAFANVRERRSEIGIMRAVGLRRRQVFAVFLSRAVLMGTVGAAFGYAIGAGVGVVWSRWQGDVAGIPLIMYFDLPLLLAALLVTPALSAVACIGPAAMAARQDPAAILLDE